jgi:ActR/RegA family two-component response regulator
MVADRILVVDDDLSWQELLHESIEGVEGAAGRTVRVVGSYAEADALLDRQHFHLAFVDLRLREEARELEGKKIVRKIVHLDEGTSVVIATGHADVSTAITALKEWKVLDFILKDAWDPEKVVTLVRAGIPAARAAYRTRYESAVDFLRGREEIMPWMARVLAAVAPNAHVARPDRRLGDFLNRLLADFYPLFPERGGMNVALAHTSGIASARCWSKALGAPVGILFGPEASVAQQTGSLNSGFTAIVRDVSDAELGLRGIVYAPDEPPFEAFAAAV